MNSNKIRFIRNDEGKPNLQVNEGSGWVHYKGSKLLSKPDWKAFKNVRMKDKTIQETFVCIQFGLKHKYEILPANAS